VSEGPSGPVLLLGRLTKYWDTLGHRFEELKVLLPNS
jgi:hypothetical protein